MLVVALGGNALLKRGEPLEADTQARNVRLAAGNLARLARHYRLVVTHGNGPQVGLLALQNAAYPAVQPYPLDMLDAQTEGLIGYLLEHELANRLPTGMGVATLLTRVQVDSADSAFTHPTKPIGPVYTAAQRQALAGKHGWQFVADGKGYRRVVPSPRPHGILNLPAVRILLDHPMVVVCAGGGGIPVTPADGGQLRGVEAVIDKDSVSCLLARQLQADMLFIATDVPAVYLDWGKPGQRAVRKASPTALAAIPFPPGSMGPKVEAACAFARSTGRPAVIGRLEDVDRFATQEAGTWISTEAAGIC